MLRDKSLIPLSHQHQHALALCVRIERAELREGDDLRGWKAEINRHFAEEIKIHFAAEENVLFPVARQFASLQLLVEELIADHAALRESFSRCQKQELSAQEISAFAKRLAEHIRKEERQLFEGLQQSLTEKELATLGEQLELALKDATYICSIPSRQSDK